MNDYFLNKFNINLPRKSPIELPGFHREDLPNVYKELGFKVGAEIGVFKGEYTLKMAEVGLKIFAIDPWTAYHDFPDQNVMDGFYEETKERLINADVEIMRMGSIDAVGQFKDESLDFVYIDGDHELKGVLDDIWHWYPKVKRGGIIAGHDYIKFARQNNSHVVQAVQAFVSSYYIPYYFITERREQRGNKIKNNQRSWFWIKA